MGIAVHRYYASEGASALYYDLITAADRSLDGDIDIYAGLIPPGGSVLELGAGTGRIAIPLAEHGFAVTGLDIAAPMLAQAEMRRAALPADVAARLRFVRGDMCSLALGGRFDAVIASYFTLAHVQPATAWKPLFASVARDLIPGGRFAVHLPLAEKMAAAGPAPGTPLFTTATPEGGSLTLQMIDQTYIARTGRFDLVLDYVTSAADGAETGRSRERYTLFCGDPLPFAERAGLRQSGKPIRLGGSGEVHIFEKPAA